LNCGGLLAGASEKKYRYRRRRSPLCKFSMSYLDIDQILCDEERIPATFLLDAPGLGHLDPSIDSEDLPENTRIELPLWLALAFGRKNMVNLELPKHFERKMRDEILAGAENINLKEFSHYFFEVGSSLAIETKNEDLKTTLQIAFAGERFRSLMMRALSRCDHYFRGA
jgi:GINS complex subunit 3